MPYAVVETSNNRVLGVHIRQDKNEALNAADDIAKDSDYFMEDEWSYSEAVVDLGRHGRYSAGDLDYRLTILEVDEK